MSTQLSDPATAEKLREYRQQIPFSRTRTMERQVTTFKELNQRANSRRNSTVLDWKQENAKRELKDMKEKLEDQKKALDEMEEKQDTIESLTKKIELLEYTNVGLIMQLRRERNKSISLQKQLELHESSDSESENSALSEELFSLSRRISMRSSLDLDDHLSNQVFTLTRKITKDYNEAIIEQNSSSSSGSGLETEESPRHAYSSSPPKPFSAFELPQEI